jgi:glycosyltransferase involved in cell wall biosynthesis
MNPFSAYVPCFNNALTVATALDSLQRQSPVPAELFLVDDGSEDNSCVIADQLGVAIVAMGRNSGRGAVRARAMELAHHEFVVCCDATNYLPDDFATQALRHFADPNVAAVFGRIWQHDARTMADRWRGRHLFMVQERLAVRHRALLSTYGCVLRRSAVLEVGNFDRFLRHSEDADLGRRLLAAGFDVIFDPSLHVIAGISNSKCQVLERYWRWYAGSLEDVSLYGYAKQVWYSLRVMALRDLHYGDPFAIPLSLLCPHYQFWRSWWRRFSGQVQR